MKKIISILLAAVLVLGLSACGTEPAATTAAQTTAAQTTEAPTTEAQTTAAPTTEAPTTAAPETTEAPTQPAPIASGEAPFEVGEDEVSYTVDGSSSWAAPATANVKIIAGEDELFNGKVTVTSDNLLVSEFIYAAIDDLGISQEGVLEGFITGIGSYKCEGNMYWMWEYQGHNPTNFAINEVHVFEGDYILLTFVDTNEYWSTPSSYVVPDKAAFEVGEDEVSYTVEGASSWAAPATANVKIVAGEDELFSGKVTVTSDNLWVSEFVYAAIDDLGISQAGVQEGFITSIGSYVGEGNMYWVWEYQGNKPTNFAVNQVHVFEGDYILVSFVDTNTYFGF